MSHDPIFDMGWEAGAQWRAEQRGQVDDEYISMVACDEAQQDWDRLDYAEVFRNGFEAGARNFANELAKLLAGWE